MTLVPPHLSSSPQGTDSGSLAKVAIIGHHVFYRPPRPYGGYPTTYSLATDPTPIASISPEPATRPVDPASGAGPIPSAATSPTVTTIAAPESPLHGTTPPGEAVVPRATPSPRSSPVVYFPHPRRTPPALAIPTSKGIASVVRVSHRRQGIGTKFVQHMKKEMRDRHVFLDAGEGVEGSGKFWKAMGIRRWDL